jgi:hypothetical protein
MDGQVGIRKAPQPDGTAELKNSIGLRRQSKLQTINEAIIRAIYNSDQ